jgi:hypothetical protein
MEGISIGDIANFGIGGVFIAYLINKDKVDREERKLRARADLRLALAIDRLFVMLTGKPLPPANLDAGVPGDEAL